MGEDAGASVRSSVSSLLCRERRPGKVARRAQREFVAGGAENWRRVWSYVSIAEV